MFDINQDGEIDVADIISRFNELGTQITEEEAIQMIKSQTEGDCLNFIDFVKILMFDTNDLTVQIPGEILHEEKTKQDLSKTPDDS